MSNAVRQDSGLATAGTSDNQEWAVNMFGSLALHGVETI
jgi:hypothetical protein